MSRFDRREYFTAGGKEVFPLLLKSSHLEKVAVKVQRRSQLFNDVHGPQHSWTVSS